MDQQADFLTGLPTNRLLAEFSLWSADLVRIADDVARVDSHVDIYHADVAEPTLESLRGAGLEASVLGGGRIAYDPAAAPPAPHVRVYGFSYGFGKADHAVSVEVCREHFGADARLEWSDEGY